MIVTVTPNPSFDRTMKFSSVALGEVNRARNVETEAGGKGINVARALARAGHRAAAAYPAGVSDGDQLAALLPQVDEFTPVPVDVGRPIRINLTVIDDDGRTTKLNESGDPLDDAGQSAVGAALSACAVGAAWVAVCGSLPPGVDVDFAARLLDQLGGSTRGAVDASGAPLAHIAANGCDLIKPNHHELEELVGVSLRTLGDVVDAAADVQRGGVSTVLVSLGSDGAVLVDGNDVIFGSAPASEVGNTVGAGDGFLAGFLAGGGSGVSALREALAWGRAAVMSPTTAFPPASDADRRAVSVTTEFDRAMRLAGD